MLHALINSLRMNPYPTYSVLRRTTPLVRIPKLDLWIALSYDDVRTILSDYTHFSSNVFRELMHPELAKHRPVRNNLIASDPPIHTKLRNLVSRAFTKQAVANLEPRIAELTHEMLDTVIEGGKMDLIRDLAYPLPVIVIAEMLGIPAEDREQFKIWSDDLVTQSDRFITDRRAINEMAAHDMDPFLSTTMASYFREIITQRRAKPGNDLISGLIAAEIDGEHLSERDLISFCSLLLIAGNVTTTNLIGNAFITLLDYPRQLDELRSDRKALLNSTIEEVLRYRSPVQFMFRIVSQDVELSGRTLRKGERVIAFIGSANRDERKFKQAQVFDISRTPNPHIAFGFGIHHCIGAPLARLEARVAMDILLERLQNIQHIGRKRLEPTPGSILHGVRSLPISFMPDERVGAQRYVPESNMEYAG